MREAAGQSVKSSVYHSWTRDTRDDKIIGTRGSYAKVFQEFAGLGGDTSFYKTEAQGQIARSLFPGVVRSACVDLSFFRLTDLPSQDVVFRGAVRIAVAPRRPVMLLRQISAWRASQRTNVPYEWDGTT